MTDTATTDTAAERTTGVTLTDADVDMMFNPGEGASTGATVATRSNG